MTDRICALTVILEKNTRDDDVVSLVQAIRHMRNVAEVKTNVSDFLAESTARIRIANELQEEFLDILNKLRAL